MANGAKCTCPRCTCRGLMGPVVLITVGALFLIGKLGWGFSFGQLWPVILIVMGIVKLAEAMVSSEGHQGA